MIPQLRIMVFQQYAGIGGNDITTKNETRAFCLAKNIHILVQVITFALNTMQTISLENKLLHDCY